MLQRRTVLVVSPRTNVLDTLVAWLEGAACRVITASGYGDARRRLSLGPDIDMLVSDLMLREYNGLHLALHAQRTGIPSLVIGPGLPGIERDARQIGAGYLSDPSEPALLAMVARQLTDVASPATTGVVELHGRRFLFPVDRAV